MIRQDSFLFFFSSRRRHTRCSRDWSSDVCSSDLILRFPHTRQELADTAFRHQKCRRKRIDRKSTRLNSSHGYISYAVFCLKKKKIHALVHLRVQTLAASCSLAPQP